MSKADWAERKALKLIFPGDKFVDLKEVNLSAEIAKLLRAERRRAVRACQKVKDAGYNQFHGNYKDVYQAACNDCARAIGGKP